MAEFGGGGGFGLEAADAVFIGELANEDEFDGDDAVEADLAGTVDHAHAAAGDFLQELVITEGGCWGLDSGYGLSDTRGWAPVERPFEHAAGAEAFRYVV